MTVVAPHPSDDYAEMMPVLERFAGLPAEDPERSRLRDELVVGYLPVVQNLARRHGRGYPGGMEDLVQAGTIALITAVDRWDPDRARGDFLSYLVPCVRGEMLRYFRDRTWSMRVPRRLNDLSVGIRRATGPLSQKLGRAPRPSELAEHLDAEVEEIIAALDAQSNQHAGTLDGGDDPDEQSPAARLGELDRRLELVEYREALRPLLEKLPSREREILLLRFFDEMTQTKIAERMGISQMHVSRLLARTLAELRRGMAGESA